MHGQRSGGGCLGTGVVSQQALVHCCTSLLLLPWLEAQLFDCAWSYSMRLLLPTPASLAQHALRVHCEPSLFRGCCRTPRRVWDALALTCDALHRTPLTAALVTALRLSSLLRLVLAHALGAAHPRTP